MQKKSNLIKCDAVRITRNFRENEIPSISSYVEINNDYFTVLNNVRIIGSFKTAMKKVMKFYSKNYSARCFGFVDFTVNEEFLAIIREYLEPCIKSKRLEKLAFFHAKLECSERELFETLGYLKIKRLNVHQSKQFRINNTHLSIFPTEIIIHPERPEHCDVNDQLLVNLLYKTPRTVYISALRTRITLQAMLSFIEKLVSKMHKSISKDNHDLFFGEVKADSYSRKQLLLAQRVPELTWRVWHATEDYREVFYTVEHDNYDLEISFTLPTVEYPKITKQQARNRIDNLRARIRHNQEENNAYIIMEDMEVMLEVQQLQDSMFCDWIELHVEVTVLIHDGIDQIDPESDDEDDD